MFTSTVFAGFTALLCTSFNFADARVVQRDVVSPKITYPTSHTVWNVNERHNVTWDTSSIPPGTNNTGMIVLGYLDANDPNNEHLDLNNPLATDFSITAGQADITVPSVPTRNTYILVLFGDSGNASPQFKINNLIISASPSSTPTTAVSSSAAPLTSSIIVVSQQSTPSAGSSTALIAQATPSTGDTVVSGSTVASTSAQLTSVSAFAASSAATSASTAQAQSAAAAQSTASSNHGVPNASHGAAATWISIIFSLALVLGFSL